MGATRDASAGWTKGKETEPMLTRMTTRLGAAAGIIVAMAGIALTPARPSGPRPAG